VLQLVQGVAAGHWGTGPAGGQVLMLEVPASPGSFTGTVSEPASGLVVSQVVYPGGGHRTAAAGGVSGIAMAAMELVSGSGRVRGPAAAVAAQQRGGQAAFLSSRDSFDREDEPRQQLIVSSVVYPAHMAAKRPTDVSAGSWAGTAAAGGVDDVIVSQVVYGGARQRQLLPPAEDSQLGSWSMAQKAGRQGPAAAAGGAGGAATVPAGGSLKKLLQQLPWAKGREPPAAGQPAAAAAPKAGSPAKGKVPAAAAGSASKAVKKGFSQKLLAKLVRQPAAAAPPQPPAPAAVPVKQLAAGLGSVPAAACVEVVARDGSAAAGKLPVLPALQAEAGVMVRQALGGGDGSDGPARESWQIGTASADGAGAGEEQAGAVHACRGLGQECP
jgi:hypothetical protein